MNDSAVIVTPTWDHVPVAERWNPWRALRARTHIVFDLGHLPDWTGGGIWYRDEEGTVIVLDRRLGRRERAAMLTHELIHDERGGVVDHRLMPSMWAPEVVKEERKVERLAALRHLPLDELAEFVDWMVESDQPVDARSVVDWFDVSYEVAETALALLLEERRRCS